ncbi:MAG: hypothetical protein KDA59_17850, partial [Planctomycetales bacterium]|nr:hypothetical protein [Planctomycetales bacterium]
RPLYTVAPGWRGRSLRLGDWKLIVRSDNRGANEASKIELYNIAADASEAKNLAEQEPERVKRMRAKLESVAATDRDSVAE